MAKPKKPTAKLKKPTEIDPKAHRRALVFLNAARAPRDLVALPLKRLGEKPPHLRRKRPDTHEPEHKVRGQKLFDLEQAKSVIKERARLSPMYGFTHIDQLGTFLDPKVFEHLRELILRWFSRISYGEWSDPVQLDPADADFSVVHAAVVKTGDGHCQRKIA